MVFGLSIYALWRLCRYLRAVVSAGDATCRLKDPANKTLSAHGNQHTCYVQPKPIEIGEQLANMERGRESERREKERERQRESREREIHLPCEQRILSQQNSARTHHVPRLLGQSYHRDGPVYQFSAKSNHMAAAKQQPRQGKQSSSMHKAWTPPKRQAEDPTETSKNETHEWVVLR